MPETFLISNSVPFRICNQTQAVSPVEPIMDTYEISQPDPRMDNVKVHLPREIVDRILEEVVEAHLRNKEFGAAACTALVDYRTLHFMIKSWVDPHHSQIPRNNEPPIRTRFRTICRSRKLFRLFYLGMVLFDHAWDVDVLPPVDDSDSETDFADGFEEMRKTDLPVIAVHHPYCFSPYGVIKPYDLVYPRQEKGHPVYWNTLFQLVAYADVHFEGFQHQPTVAWTGSRACDCLVMDASTEHGIYFSKQTLFPLVILRIDTDVGEGSSEWEGARWHWERLAHMVHTAYEGATLYVLNKFVAKRV